MSVVRGSTRKPVGDSRGIRLGVVGTGWVGRTRARIGAADGHVAELHLVDIDPEALALAADESEPTTTAIQYRELIDDDRVDAVIISTAPETTHFPIARDFLTAGKDVLLEKPMALTLDEADHLISLAEDRRVMFTVGYSQRFRPKFAFVKEQLSSGRLGRPTSVMISRHITRDLGTKIASRGRLGPAQMEATHDIDLALWWLAPRRPARVYAQSADGIMQEPFGLPDCTWIVITMEDNSVIAIGAGWSLPLESPGFSSVFAEVVGTEGAIFVDGTHRDLVVSSVQEGVSHPLSTMPGRTVGAVYDGPMEAETKHFIDVVYQHWRDPESPVRPIVAPEQARIASEVALAAERSAASGQPVLISPVRDMAQGSLV